MGITKENGKFRARVSIGHGKRKSLGRYDTYRKAQLAISRYRKQEMHEQAQEDELDKSLKDLFGEDALAPAEFIPTPIDERKPISPPKPTIMTRIRTRVGIWNEWLKRQLDS